MGVLSECCCKEVYYRYPYSNYYFPLLHLYQLFFGQHHPYFFVHLKCFFVLVFIVILQGPSAIVSYHLTLVYMYIQSIF